MKKSNILHLTNTYGAERGGGVHEVVSNFYKYQKQNGLNPTIWYPEETDLQNVLDKNHSIKSLPTYNFYNYSVLKGIFGETTKEASEFDIIHQHGIWTTMSLFSKRLSKKNRIKLVIQPHGFLEPYRLNISKYKKKLAFYLYEKSNLTNCSALIACSDDEGIKLKKLFPNQHVAVIYNGIGDNFFRAKSQKAQNKNKKILFLSQIIPVKGLDRLFKIISDIDRNLLNEFEFVIAGYGLQEYIDSLKKLAIKLRIQDLIKFIGPIHGQEKINIYDNSDFFILPTYSENYGIVVAEALARGLPVITTKGTPWSELNSSNSGLWVENTDEGLRNGLMKMLTMPESNKRTMRKNGRELIENKYLWEKTSLRTLELYEWIIFGGTKPDFII